MRLSLLASVLVLPLAVLAAPEVGAAEAPTASGAQVWRLWRDTLRLASALRWPAGAQRRWAALPAATGTAGLLQAAVSIASDFVITLMCS